jgi:hypothetical protein
VAGIRAGDALAAALEDAATTVDESARTQHRAADMAREVAASRRADAAGARCDDPDRETRTMQQLVGLLAGSTRTVTQAVGRIRRAWARSLSTEGLSIRAIGERFGVSHQRVSALLSPSSAARDEDAG